MSSDTAARSSGARCVWVSAGTSTSPRVHLAVGRSTPHISHDCSFSGGRMPGGRSVDLYRLPARVPPTVVADDVGNLARSTPGAQAARGRIEGPGGGPTTAALGLGGLLLG